LNVKVHKNPPTIHIMEKMEQETKQEIEIQTNPNPWLFGVAFFAAFGALFQPNLFGFAYFLVVFVVIIVWWLFRAQSVIIYFDKREAAFINSPLNPLQKKRMVPLAEFSRVYASPFYKNAGWSIHLSGPRGEHLLLARMPSSPFAPSFRDDYVRSLCVRIASGLQIADGGGG